MKSRKKQSTRKPSRRSRSPRKTKQTRPKPPQQASKPRRRAPAAATASVDLEREIARLRSTRSRLERRLTAMVKEIGLLRQYEMRARFLEAEVQKRDQQIAELRHQYEQRIRDPEPHPAAN
jgi:hypothetical protein